MEHSARAYRVALTALFFAISLVLSLVEGALPALPVPGVKLGLSNIAAMYTLLFVGQGPALTVAVLKAGFAALTRGPAAGFLSLCGGLVSMGSMIFLIRLTRDRCSVLLLSVCGGILHNLGQLAGASLLYGSGVLWGWLPVLAAAGMAAGAVTALLLKALLPALKRIPQGRTKL